MLFIRFQGSPGAWSCILGGWCMYYIKKHLWLLKYIFSKKIVRQLNLIKISFIKEQRERKRERASRWCESLLSDSSASGRMSLTSLFCAILFLLFFRCVMFVFCLISVGWVLMVVLIVHPERKTGDILSAEVWVVSLAAPWLFETESVIGWSVSGFY